MRPKAHKHTPATGVKRVDMLCFDFTFFVCNRSFSDSFVDAYCCMSNDNHFVRLNQIAGMEIL